MAIDLPGQGSDRTPVAAVTLDGYARRICEVLAQPLRLEDAHREAFARLSRAYVVCTQDRAIPPAL